MVAYVHGTQLNYSESGFADIDHPIANPTLALDFQRKRRWRGTDLRTSAAAIRFGCQFRTPTHADKSRLPINTAQP
jgi:hypothetical protein